MTGKLVTENPLFLNHWIAALKDVGKNLLPPLSDFLQDEKPDPSQRRAGAAMYRAFANEDQGDFAVLEQIALTAGPPPLMPDGKMDSDKAIAGATRRANVAAALVAMGRASGSGRSWPIRPIRHFAVT